MTMSVKENAAPAGTGNGAMLINSDSSDHTAKTPDVQAILDVFYRRCASDGQLNLGWYWNEPGGGIPLPAARVDRDNVAAIADGAERARRFGTGPRGVVFAVPVALFDRSTTSFTERDVVECPGLYFDLDSGDVDAAQASLEAVLGEPTFGMYSGGVTAEGQSKRHLFWRLTEAATGHQLDLLKRVRKELTSLVGGDASGANPQHPFRWPTSWHTKVQDHERQCEITHLSGNEVELSALAALAESEPLFEASVRKGEPVNPDHLAVFASMPNPDYGWHEWNNIGMAFFAATGGGRDGFEAFRSWSSGSAKHDDDACEERWSNYHRSPPGRIGAGTLYDTYSRLTGQRVIDAVAQRAFASAPVLNVVPLPPPPQRSRFFSAASLAGKPVKPRDWLVQDLVPGKTVTLFGGDGGTGKSLLALQLAVAVAGGRDWIGRPVKPGKVIFLSAEDDEEELHRRLHSILAAKHLTFDAVPGLTLRSLAGEDALLASDGAALTATPLFKELETYTASEQPVLVVLDTLADLYPANENDRAKVRQFVGLLRGLAIRQDCAVVMLSHPSLTGMASGTGASGSTAWNNSVRSRLYLSRVVEDGYEPNPDARVLSVKKANYGRVGTELNLSYREGLFWPQGGGQPVDASAKAERVFLKLLRAFTDQGRRVNGSGGLTYAPKLFAEHPEAEGCNKRVLRTAMDVLLQRETIRVAHEGPPSRRVSYLIEVKE